MNYGEQLTYWYLRLNGFFPIAKFVVHKSEDVPHSSDVDVLAVRPPHVYEEIGGQPDDWDDYLSQNLRFGRPIGLVCEVKTGAFEEAKLFRREPLRYTLPRLGLAKLERIDQAVETLTTSPSVELEDGAVIAKLLVSPGDHTAGPYLNRPLAKVEDFLTERVRRYPVNKYADRMFFPPDAFQLIIGQVHRKIEERKKA